MPYLSIREAAEELHSGLITPTELIAETLERIERLDSDIKAFITVMDEQALKDAEQAEREMRTGLYRGQLHGIPIGMKDIIAVKNVHMTAGSKVLAAYVPREDPTVVERLRRAGPSYLRKPNTHTSTIHPITP